MFFIKLNFLLLLIQYPSIHTYIHCPISIIHACINTYTHTYIYTCIHTHIHTYTHTCTHVKELKYVIYYIPTARPCPSPIATVENAAISSSIFLHGYSVDVTCIPGHRFPDKKTVHMVTCGIDGRWDKIVPSCQG